MRDDMFANPSLDTLPRPSQPLSSDPGRGLRNGPRPVGGLLYLVFMGLVASAIIGVFFGAGFFLLAAPARQIVADSAKQHDGNPSLLNADAPQMRREPPAALPDRAAVATLPSPPLAQHAAVTPAPTPQEEKKPPNSVAEHPSETTAQTTLEPEPPSGPSGPPTPVISLPGPTPSSPQGALAPSGAKRPATHDGRSNHKMATSQHPQPRSVRRDRPLTPPQSPRDRPVSTEAAGTDTFDQILTRLSQRTQPVAGSLTPPPLSQPDPFTQPPGTNSRRAAQ
jgi:hypothetical protein